MYEFDASDGGFFQLADLSFDEELERDLRYKKSRAGSRCVANGCEDVESGQTGQGMNGVQGSAKSLVEYVANTSSTASETDKVTVQMDLRSPKKRYLISYSSAVSMFLEVPSRVAT